MQNKAQGNLYRAEQSSGVPVPCRTKLRGTCTMQNKAQGYLYNGQQISGIPVPCTAKVKGICTMHSKSHRNKSCAKQTTHIKAHEYLYCVQQTHGCPYHTKQTYRYLYRANPHSDMTLDVART